MKQCYGVQVFRCGNGTAVHQKKKGRQERGGIRGKREQTEGSQKRDGEARDGRGEEPVSGVLEGREGKRGGRKYAVDKRPWGGGYRREGEIRGREFTGDEGKGKRICRREKKRPDGVCKRGRKEGRGRMYVSATCSNGTGRQGARSGRLAPSSIPFRLCYR